MRIFTFKTLKSPGNSVNGFPRGSAGRVQDGDTCIPVADSFQYLAKIK